MVKVSNTFNSLFCCLAGLLVFAKLMRKKRSRTDKMDDNVHEYLAKARRNVILLTILLCKGKMQYLLIGIVSIYYLLPLQCRITGTVCYVDLGDAHFILHERFPIQSLAVLLVVVRVSQDLKMELCCGLNKSMAWTRAIYFKYNKCESFPKFEINCVSPSSTSS